MVADQLERVAVAGADQDVKALVAAAPGQRRDSVVGLIAGHLDDRDPQRGEHLLDQRDLTR